jgi:hypothetical protein
VLIQHTFIQHTFYYVGMARRNRGDLLEQKQEKGKGKASRKRNVKKGAREKDGEQRPEGVINERAKKRTKSAQVRCSGQSQPNHERFSGTC